MGFANKRLENLRKIARSKILPTQEICNILESNIDFASLHKILDFGAGTLYFSEYFAKKLLEIPSNELMKGEISSYSNIDITISHDNKKNERERSYSA